MEKLLIGITQGDTNSVNFEIIFKAFSDPTLFELCTPVLYANPRLVTYHRKACNATINFSTIRSISEAREDRLNVMVCDDEEVPVELGQGTEVSGRQAKLALDAALRDCLAGELHALVAMPLNEHVIPSFPGLSQYLWKSTTANSSKEVNITLSGSLRVALLTSHLPLSQVASGITKEAIVTTVTALQQSLRRDFGVTEPRVAVLSLNPHAGDGGEIGTEEQHIIIPAIQEVSEHSVHAYGPYAVDEFFAKNLYSHFDAVLAMYHDQVMAAAQTLSNEVGTMYVGGLPFVFTTPKHGLQYALAGKNESDPAPLLQALYAAIDISRSREFYDESHASPLGKLYYERREDDRRSTRTNDRPAGERTQKDSPE
ncbi:MAG: 4-hydroxythreonine-4-phosphate dehydrogenase PdxA [Bacteroidaceae bacterium]|nr:4-hydroxythreonine-4-phosphate dehydrogenase PdxA [Bacteroidaceae bacterium]